MTTHSQTMSNQGELMRDAAGNLKMADGYRVLIDIENYRRRRYGRRAGLTWPAARDLGGAMRSGVAGDQPQNDE